MRGIERLLVKLPHSAKYHLKKFERPLKQIRNAAFAFRHNATSIAYVGYDIRYPKILYRYEAGSKRYEHILNIDKIPQISLNDLRSDIADKLLNHIGLSFVADCFRLDDFDEVRVGPSGFSEASGEFFGAALSKGLAELRYRNGLNPGRRTRFLFSEDRGASPNPYDQDTKPTALALLGGGKESIVMGELLKRMAVPFRWFTFNGSQWGEPMRRVIEASGVENAINVEFKFDSRLYDDAKYMGSYPFLIPISFISILFAHLLNIKYVIIGNERSANTGNFNYRGIEVNHQYEKSFEFELAFDSYVRQNLVSGIKYFSLVRPLYEIAIARILATFPQYLEHFVSCNNVYKQRLSNRWCKECPKCAFVFIALYPFMDENLTMRVFGQNFFEIRSIRQHIVDLCAAKKRPFECIGTREECRLALKMCLEKSPWLDFSKKPRRKELMACSNGIEVDELRKAYLDLFHDEHNIPQELVGPVRLSIKSILTSSGP